MIARKSPQMDIARGLERAPAWHQRWEIFEAVFTPGRKSVEILDGVGLPKDLSGLRVLDVGAFNGCYRRGAAEVVAMDLQDHPNDLGFELLKGMLGSKVRFVQFDIVLFLGVLYHLRYPLLSFDQLRKVTGRKLYLETLVIDHRFLEGGKDFPADQRPSPCIS